MSECVGHGSIRSILDDMKLLSTEAEGVNVAIPEADRPLLVNSAGRVGALLGLKASEPGMHNFHAGKVTTNYALIVRLTGEPAYRLESC